MQTVEASLQKQIAPRGSSIYYSLLFVSNEQRAAICAVRAFAKAVGEIILECRDRSVALSKFSWWRGELQQLFSTTPTHPITQALNSAIHHFKLPPALFQEFMEGVAQDLTKQDYSDFEELIHYFHHTAGAIERIIAHILGFADTQTLTAMNHLGISMQIIRNLRDLRRVLMHQHCYIAHTDLEQMSVSLSQLQQCLMSNEIHALLVLQAQHARKYYQMAMEQLPHGDRYNQSSTLILAELSLKLLDQMINPKSNVFKEQISLTPLKKLILSWRIDRREKKLYA